MRIALGVEYDGASYHGWQLQTNCETVQGTLERALSQVADHPVALTVAGRTDAGVHAIAQVVHFESSANRKLQAWVLGVNANLPRQIRVIWAVPVSDQFHARFGAIERNYRYLIINRPTPPGILFQKATWERETLDDEAMHLAAQCLVGEHDFTSFRASSCQSKSPVRNLTRISVTRNGDMVAIDVSANAFLHHMIRNLAGTLIKVGLGEKPTNWVGTVLEARDRTMAGVTAPPDGLYLTNVSYPEHFALPSTESDQWLW